MTRQGCEKLIKTHDGKINKPAKKDKKELAIV